MIEIERIKEKLNMDIKELEESNIFHGENVKRGTEHIGKNYLQIKEKQEALKILETIK